MRVPQFTQQVGQDQAPNVRVQGGLSPGEAVGMVGSQIDGIANLANTGASIYQQQQDEADRVRVMDAQNQLAELKLRLQNDENKGYVNKKGVDVVSFDSGDGEGFVDYYQRSYLDGVGEISNKLSNNRQRNMFSQIASEDQLRFKSTLQSYFVRENDTYQQSVYTASADRFVMNINNNPADFKAIDENRANLQAAIAKSMQLDGKSALEAENIYLKTISAAHITNMTSFIDNGDLRGALQYKNKYQNEVSLDDAFKIERKVKQELENQQVQMLVNQATTGTQENSNPALNIPPQASAAVAKELSSLTPEQMKNIKYNDQRLDVYTVHSAKQKGMEWAAPLLLGIRLAGERSDNSAVSEKGAQSVMQFIPATWGEYSKGGKRDINNPIDTIDAAVEFVGWISEKYNTRDPMVIAAYYNGGGKAAEAVKRGKMPPASETRAYLQRLDDWLTNGFGEYSKKPQKTREQATEEIWNSGAPVEVKQKALAASDRYYKSQDDFKKEKQTQVYDHYYKAIGSGQFTYEQIPASDFSSLAPNQIASLRSFSKSIYTDVKTDPLVFSMIALNREELFKGKPQSVLHQYADKLSPSDYKEATKMYVDVNKLDKSKEPKEKVFLINDATVASALKPYLNTIGVTDTKNKDQLLHYNAVKTDLVQTLREAEAKNGGYLSWPQISRLVLKNLNTNVKITTTGVFGGSSTELNRMYAQVKRKSDITPKMLDKISDTFKKQGRNPDKVTDSEYLNAYYSLMRRGF